MHGSPPHGRDEVLKYFGNPDPIAGKASLRWEAANMILVRDLPGVPKLYVHRKIVEPLRAALDKSAEMMGWHPTTIGCFAVRNKRGGSGLSLHAFGAAVDVDADTNPMLLDCPPSDPRRVTGKTIPDEVVDIWRAEGWNWGGGWQGSRYDPMHFQFADGV